MKESLDVEKENTYSYTYTVYFDNKSCVCIYDKTYLQLDITNPTLSQPFHCKINTEQQKRTDKLRKSISINQKRKG